MSNEKDQKRAAEDLRAIEELKRNPAYREYFERRVEEELAKLREKILTNRKLTAEGLFNERLLYFAALDTSEMMARDEAGCRNILGAGGEED
jgi:hypothetical protein